MLKKFIFFFLIGACFYSASTTHAQNNNDQLADGLWRLIELETFDVDRRPLLLTKGDKVIPKNPVDEDSESNFLIDGKYISFYYAGLQMHYFIEDNKRFYIYDDITDVDRNHPPFLSFDVVDRSPERIVFERTNNEKIYRYTYQLAK